MTSARSARLFSDVWFVGNKRPNTTFESAPEQIAREGTRLSLDGHMSVNVLIGS